MRVFPRFQRIYLRILLFTLMGWTTGFTVSAVVAQTVGPASVSELVTELSGAVVNIGTSRVVEGGNGVPFPRLPEGSPLRELFEELNPNYGQRERLPQEARSLGSGFFISAEGLVVTNNHVIEGAEEILIYTADGERFVAELVGADEKTDLAVLKIDADAPVPFVEFGDSDTAEVGDWVMAIGNPFGLGGSVSLGIVSARHRDINTGPYDDFIQTDAAINQGNSGGPLFDMNGDVVGIATAIIARGGSSRGIGFAIPVNLARPVIEQLSEFGETRRGWLGVGIQDVTEDVAVSLGHRGTAGALVVDVTPGGPSEGALKSGDLILNFDGRDIVTMTDLPRIVALTPVGKSVTVQIIRDGESLEIAIELGRLETGERLIAEARTQTKLPKDGDVPATDDGKRLSPDVREMIGLSVAPLTRELRDELGVVGSVSGVLIAEVLANSDAEEKGLLPGLIISEVNQNAVQNVTELDSLIKAAREAGRLAVLFRVFDASGISRYVAVRLG